MPAARFGRGLLLAGVLLAATGCATTTAGTVRRPGSVPFWPAPRVHIGLCDYRQPEVAQRRVSADVRSELPAKCKAHYPDLSYTCAPTGGIGEDGRQIIGCTGTRRILVVTEKETP